MGSAIADIRTTKAIRDVFLPGKTTGQVTAIVKDPGHLNCPFFAMAIEKEMPWLFHVCAVHSVPAQQDVVRPRPVGHNFKALFRAGPFGSRAEIPLT